MCAAWCENSGLIYDLTWQAVCGPKRALFFSLEHSMDAEQINQIGTALTDLAARSLDLRGYL
jgi:hypothetical protein